MIFNYEIIQVHRIRQWRLSDRQAITIYKMFIIAVIGVCVCAICTFIYIKLLCIGPINILLYPSRVNMLLVFFT